MSAEEIFKRVKASKKYGCICDETIMRLAGSEAEKRVSEKDAVKAVKTRLHVIAGAFSESGKLAEAEKLLDAWSAENGGEIAERILGLHKSSAERMGFGREMYRDILGAVGEGGAVLDIACGLNPFAAPLMGRIDRYIATDIDTRVVSLVNRFFGLAGIPGVAIASDVLYRIPVNRVKNTLLFKIVPLLEQQKKGFSAELAESLDSEFLTITFPTRSLSGKNVGMAGFYRDFIRASFPEDRFRFCFDKEYQNELLYIIRRKKR